MRNDLYHTKVNDTEGNFKLLYSLAVVFTFVLMFAVSEI